MVKLNRIYTRTGDDGTTGLGDGSRVPKTSPRVAAYGTVDEANAGIGLCLVQPGVGELAGLGELLQSIQQDLFDVGGDLCIPVNAGRTPGPTGKVRDESTALRTTPGQTARLEEQIDLWNERLTPLRSFVLPGGSPLAAALHVARTVARRAERDVISLIEAEPEATNPETVRYLNRLSDLLFVLARVANSDGRDDVLWIPGANRGAGGGGQGRGSGGCGGAADSGAQ